MNSTNRNAVDHIVRCSKTAGFQRPAAGTALEEVTVR